MLQLHRYVDAIVKDEWHAMAAGFSNTAGRELTKLAHAAFAAPRVEVDVRPRIARLAELRALRLGQTGDGIVPVLWFALQAMPIVLLAAFALGNDANPAFHYMQVGLVGLVLSLALFGAIEIDLPYQGTSSISPEPIAQAIRAAESVQDVIVPSSK
jgi:hypothetical protein